MNIAVIGTGYVGLVTGACFAEVGNVVTCADIDSYMIESIKRGVIPIFEPGLEEMVSRNYREKRIFFSTDVKEAIANSTICIIAVGTPMCAGGKADLSYTYKAAEEIGQYMEKDMIIANKSTVPVGTADKMTRIVSEEIKKRGELLQFEVVSNPEFLKEGTAINDFMHPDRIVIGARTENAINIMRDLYAPFVANRDRFVIMDVVSAEMTKYASNAMLATRVSFMNEIAGICEAVGADINSVRLGMGADERIGTKFLYAGCGYGGSCFPKDMQALINTARENGVACDIIESVELTNNRQKRLLAKKIVDYFGENLLGFSFALWGVSFKPNTNDIRGAPSLVLINELIARGASLRIYDPKAMGEVAKQYPANECIVYCNDKYEAVKGVDALVISTEWRTFRSPNFEEMLTMMKQPVIFDGRNLYRAGLLNVLGFSYFQIGVGKQG